MRFVEVLESNNMVIKEGDTKDIFKLGLSYLNGTKPDLTNAIVDIFIASEDGVVVTKTMDIEDVEGVVSFELTDEDITGTGALDAEIIVIYPDGKRETFPSADYVAFKVVPSIEKRGEFTFVDHYEVIVSRVEQLKQELEEAVEQAKVELGSGTHTHALEGLTDVLITDAINGQVLTYNGSKWVNGEANDGTIDYAELENKPSINNIELNGNKNASDLNLADKQHRHGYKDLDDLTEDGDVDIIWDAYVVGGGDSSGDDIVITTTDYSTLANKPIINGIILSGSLTSTDLSLADKNHKHFYSELDGVPKIPSKTSDLENDSTYVTSAELENAFEEYDTHTHSYNELTNKPVIPSKLSDLTNDLSLPSVEYIDQKLEAKANVVHKHSISNVTDLQQILDNKSNNGHAHAINEVQGLTESLESKADVQHTHGLYEINNLNTQLNAKADVQHTHSIEDISFLQPYLDSKSDDGHSHSFSSLTDKPTIPTLVSQLINDDGFVTNDEMMVAIGNAQLGGGEGDVDLSYYATKEELNNVTSILNNKAELDHIHTVFDVIATVNLYDSESPENLLDTDLNNDGTFSTNDYYKVTHKINVIGGETYSATCSGIWLYVMPYDENDNALLNSVHCDGRNGFTITVPENASYIRICIENYKNIDESSIIFNANVDLQTVINNKAELEHTHSQYLTEEEMLEALDSIKNVGRNLLKNSDVVVTNPKYPMIEYEITQNIPEGTEVTVSLKGTLGEGKEGFSLYNSGGTVEIVTLYRNSFNSDGVAVKTFNWRVAGASNDKLRIYPILGSVTAESTIEWIKLEYGNKQTPYTKAPEDAVDSAKKLETARKITLSGAVTGEGIMFDGTSNVDYQITSLKSEYLKDTVPNAKNGVFPLEAKTYDITRACRTAFLPADQIYVEYTRDNGNTWKEYPLTDERKQGLFSMNRGTYLSIGGTDLTDDPTDVKRSIGNATRVTIVPWKSNGTAERYTSFDTFYAWFSAGGDRINVKIERSTIGAKDTFETIYENDAMKFSGWSDAGNIKIPYGTFGGASTQTANHYAYRITFKTALIDGSTNLTNTSSIQTVTDLRFYGEQAWTTSNNMMKQDHVYTWDVNGTVDFPKHVRATGNLAEGGEWLTNKYAPKSHTHDEYITSDEIGAISAENMIFNGDCKISSILPHMGEPATVSRGASATIDSHGLLYFGSNLTEAGYDTSTYCFHDYYGNGEFLTQSNKYTFVSDFRIPSNSNLNGSNVRILCQWYDSNDDLHESRYSLDEMYGGTFPKNKWVTLRSTLEFGETPEYSNIYRYLCIEWDNLADYNNIFYMYAIQLTAGENDLPFKNNPHDAIYAELLNKADVEHTHEEYITSDEVNELVGNVDVDNIPISSITAPKNLYDENSPDNIPDANVDSETGAIIDNTMTGATLSHKMKVNAGDTYILTITRSAYFFVLFYNSSDLMIGMREAYGNSPIEIVVPENTTYVRFYDAYGNGTARTTFIRYDEVTRQLEEMSNHNHDNLYYKKELIDQSKFTMGYFGDNGEVLTGNYPITDFIKVYPNVEYIYTFSNLGDMICFYDENKNFVSIKSAMRFTEDRNVDEVTIVPPEGVYYLRMEASVESLSYLLSLTLKKDLIETIINFELTSVNDIDTIWNES